MRPGFGPFERPSPPRRAALLTAALAAAQTETPAGVGVIVRSTNASTRSCRKARRSRKSPTASCSRRPVWRSADSRLFYSDLRGNAIYQWTAAEGVRDHSKPFFGGDGTGLRGVGPNGIALDSEGVCSPVFTAAAP
jgi:hypothetical protein